MRYKYPAVTDVQHLQVRVLTRVASAVPSRGGVGHRPVERGWGTETACTGSSLTLSGAQPLLCSTRPGGRSGDRSRQDSWRNTPECDRRQSGDGSVSALP